MKKKFFICVAVIAMIVAGSLALSKNKAKEPEKVGEIFTTTAEDGAFDSNEIGENVSGGDAEEKNASDKILDKNDSNGKKAESADSTSAPQRGLVSLDEPDAGAAGEVNEKEITVHVLGAVENPGVYTLKEGSRLVNAIEAAGGCTEDGDADYLNLAYECADSMRIVVPTKKEADKLRKEAAEGDFSGADGIYAGISTGIDAIHQDAYIENFSKEKNKEDNSDSVKDESMEASEGKLININTASKEELMTLSGVGEAKATAIIEYREANGGFKDITDIMQVSGIKEGSYNKFKDKITIGK
jgi:competence protein ComEA